MKMKIIIWGHPLHSHTFSYVNDAFYKAFKFLGYDVYWFNDDNFPENFFWDGCIFLTEGFSDKNIPLKKTCTYLVHGPPNPKKYIDINPKRFVDIRYNHIWMKDHIYEYTLDKTTVEHVGKSCFFQKKENKIIRFKNEYHDYDIEDYDKFYISWATNLLPHEINLDDVYYTRKNSIWYCGSIFSDGRCENYSVYKPFIDECNKLKIDFLINDPWKNPLSNEDVIRKTKDSLIGIDLRGPEHLRNGYLPCRVMKNISYGHLGTTNSFEVYKELEGNCLYEKNPSEILYKALDRKNDFSFIKNTMIYIKENHTYINRINSLLKIL